MRENMSEVKDYSSDLQKLFVQFIMKYHGNLMPKEKTTL